MPWRGGTLKINTFKMHRLVRSRNEETRAVTPQPIIIRYISRDRALTR